MIRYEPKSISDINLYSGNFYLFSRAVQEGVGRKYDPALYRTFKKFITRPLQYSVAPPILIERLGPCAGANIDFSPTNDYEKCFASS